jgi:ATP-dependent DNA helicase PIF1
VHALTRVFRQKEDKFVRILERMRKGKVEESDIEALRACRRVVYYEDDIEPVGL